MQNNQETQSVLERRIDMSVPMAEIEKEVQSRLKRMARTVKMPGFRPGKVPMKIVEQTYGMQARSEAVGAAVEKAFGEQVRAQNMRVAGAPRIEPKDGAEEGTLAFSAVFEIYPEITVGDLSTQTVDRPQIEIGDSDVTKTLDVLRKQRTSYEETDRAAQEGDRVVVDFVGRKDGEEFEGGKAQGFPFVVGAGAMLKDFDAAVRGLKAEESKTFDLTFPDDYHAANLAGQTVQFDVTVKRVEAPVLPELDAEFATALGVGDGNVDKLREEVKANLEREVKRRIQGKVKEQVFEALLAVTPIEVPKALVDSESRQLAENAKRDLEMRGMKAKDVPVEPSWFTEQASRRVKLGLIMAELVNQHGLLAKPEQIKALIEEMAQSYEDPAELVRWYYAQPERLSQAEAVVIEDNIVTWALSQVQTVDKETSFDELMESAA